MAAPAERPSFREIYHQQYHEISSSKSSRISQVCSPIIILAVAVVPFLHTAIVQIILGALAVILLTVVIAMTRRQHHSHADHHSGCGAWTSARSSCAAPSAVSSTSSALV